MFNVKLNTQVAQAMGLVVIDDEEEASQYTDGAYWVDGGEYFAVKVYYAVPKNNYDEDTGEVLVDPCEYYLSDYENDPYQQILMIEFLRSKLLLNIVYFKDHSIVNVLVGGMTELYTGKTTNEALINTIIALHTKGIF